MLYFTKGLGDVVAAEVAALVPAAEIRQQQSRFLTLTMTTAEAARLGSQARTVDDARLLIAGPARIGGQAGFAALCAAAAGQVQGIIAGSGGQPPGTWSVTLSARNPAWRAAPAWDPAPLLARHFPGAHLTATERSPVDLRVQADGEMVHIALSLWDRPVGKRGDDGPPRPGALRPAVAAALVRLAIGAAGAAAAKRGVYDPFCGTGTVAAEAAYLGLPVFASDIDERAVERTRLRLAGTGSPAAGLRHNVFAHDVRRGPPQRVSAVIVAANLPWGKQVAVPGRLALFDAVALLARHLVAGGGAAALLTTHEEPLIARLRRQRLTVSSRRIGLLGQTPAIVIARVGQAAGPPRQSG